MMRYGLRFLISLVLVMAYVMPFWGNFRGKVWPEFVRDYSGCATQWAWKMCRETLGLGSGSGVPYRLVWLAVSIVLGGILPLGVMAVLRRWPSNVGMGLPNRWGRRVILIGLAIILPMSFIFAIERLRMPDRGQPAGQASFQVIDLFVAVGVSVPEHMLLTGVAVALLLPGMRLGRETSKRQNVKTSKGKADPASAVPGQERRNAEMGRLRPVACASGSGKRQPVARVGGGVGDRVLSTWLGVLRWLELGMAGRPGDSWFQRGLAWWGLEPAGLWAILGGGFLFGAVHVGARPIEFMTSFPGGVLLCYVTYRSGSIWPGWCVHVVQMVLVGVIMFMDRSLRG